jgi:acetylornithine/LysW-gamma-L-lysine aminotransferase
VREVRGLGLMVAVELRERSTKHLRALQERGIIALPAGATTLRFLPPLIIDREAVDQLVETLSEVLGRSRAA